ncbi:hypothetical protein MCAMS1_00736 [biofilm metagenome]
MNRNIFMPTDFSQASLDLIEQTLADAGNDELMIVLTLCMFQTDSISELLFYDKDEFIASLESRKFNKSLRMLRNKYPDANAKFTWEVFTGLNLAAFNNFVIGNKINEAVVPENYFPLTNTARNFDPTSYLRRSRLKVTRYPVQLVA